MKCAVCSAENAEDAAQCATCGVALVPTDDPSVLQPGTQLHGGAYAVGQCVGHGGFGITYRATDLKLRRLVAIKEYFPSGCARLGTTVKPSCGWTTVAYQDGRQRFLLEGEALARFDHPGIVRVHGAFEENDTAYLVMEFLQGRNLEQILGERGGRLPVAEALVCATKIGAALDVVHAAGLLHRDIKPGNIMVVGSGSFLANPRVVLVDFGAAREFAAGMSKTQSVVVTRGYAPLEQYARLAARGPYTDVYAMAAVLYETLTGSLPPEAPDRAHGSTVRDVSMANPEVDDAMGRAIMRGLEMEVPKRPQTVQEFLAELNGSLASPAPEPNQTPTVLATSLAPAPGSPTRGPNASGGQGHSGNPAASLPLTVVAGSPGGGSAPAGVVRGVSLAAGGGRGSVSAVLPRSAQVWGWGIAALVAVVGMLGLLVGMLGDLINVSSTGPASVASTAGPLVLPSHVAGRSQSTPTAVSPPPGATRLTGLRMSGCNAQGFQEFINERDGTILVKISGGTFQMGSIKYDAETPIHSVTLPPYLIGRVPVTNAQFTRFVSATNYDAGQDWRNAASEWGDQAPVVCVSWNDAKAYCTWAGLRLPTEEEWEYAARGRQSLLYPWGNAWDPARCQNSAGNNPGRAAPVGSFPSGASPFGCLDMAGNVWEWTSSWYDRYPGNTTSSNLFGHKYIVLRGGAWYNLNPTYFRGAFRNWTNPGLRNNYFGWRCARAL